MSLLVMLVLLLLMVSLLMLPALLFVGARVCDVAVADVVGSGGGVAVVVMACVFVGDVRFGVVVVVVGGGGGGGVVMLLML